MFVPIAQLLKLVDHKLWVHWHVKVVEKAGSIAASGIQNQERVLIKDLLLGNFLPLGFDQVEDGAAAEVIVTLDVV